SAVGVTIAAHKQMPGRRHDQVAGIPAVREAPGTAHGAAEIFFPALARLAGAAADPGMRQPTIADLDAFGIRTDRHHFTDILVAERHRQPHAAIGKAELFAAAEIKPPLREMNIAVADTRCQNLQQNLAAFRLRSWLFVEL